MSAPDIAPERLRVFFTLTALLHAAAILSAFPALEARLPAWLPATVLWAHFPLLLLGGYLQGRVKSDEPSSLPLWMRLDKRASFSFALAVSYLFIVVLKTYQISLGPVDPLQAPSAEFYGRVYWYGLWSLGASGLLTMGPAATLVAVLSAVTSPVRRLPPALSIGVIFVVGLGLGYGVLQLMASASVRASVLSVYALTPQLALGVTVALAVFSLLYRLLLSSDK